MTEDHHIRLLAIGHVGLSEYIL